MYTNMVNCLQPLEDMRTQTRPEGDVVVLHVNHKLVVFIVVLTYNVSVS